MPSPIPSDLGANRSAGHPSPVVTLREVAEACGVSRMTVSRALRGMSLVEPGRAAEIRAKAVELGYRPNQALNRLMSATRLSAQGGYLGNIALITTGLRSYMQQEHQGIRQQAELFRFKLDEFTPKPEGLTGGRMASILNARGIRGVILSPGDVAAPTRYSLPPGRFACVLLGKSLRNHGMMRVQHDHYQAAVMAMNQLRRRGYRRPGLIIRSGLHDRSWRCYAAAMAAYGPPGVDLARSVYLKSNTADLDPGALRTWLRQYRPDAVLVEDLGDARFLRRSNAKLGLVVMNASPSVGQWTGVVQQGLQIGREAVSLLARLLLADAPHESDNPPVINVPGRWQEGESLPPRDPATGRRRA